MTSLLTAKTTGTRCGTPSAPAVASCATGEEANLSLASKSAIFSSGCDSARMVNSRENERYVHYLWRGEEWQVAAQWTCHHATAPAGRVARSPAPRYCGPLLNC